MNKFITPTKESPVFRVMDMYTGFTITEVSYKCWMMDTHRGKLGGETSAIDLLYAIEIVHNYFKENYENMNKGRRVAIEMVDGSLDKYGEAQYTKCYTLSFAQAKKFNII